MQCIARLATVLYAAQIQVVRGLTNCAFQLRGRYSLLNYNCLENETNNSNSQQAPEMKKNVSDSAGRSFSMDKMRQVACAMQEVCSGINISEKLDYFREQFSI